IPRSRSLRVICTATIRPKRSRTGSRRACRGTRPTATLRSRSLPPDRKLPEIFVRMTAVVGDAVDEVACRKILEAVGLWNFRFGHLALRDQFFGCVVPDVRTIDLLCEVDVPLVGFGLELPPAPHLRQPPDRARVVRVR